MSKLIGHYTLSIFFLPFINFFCLVFVILLLKMDDDRGQYIDRLIEKFEVMTKTEDIVDIQIEILNLINEGIEFIHLSRYDRRRNQLPFVHSELEILLSFILDNKRWKSMKRMEPELYIIEQKLIQNRMVVFGAAVIFIILYMQHGSK